MSANDDRQSITADELLVTYKKSKLKFTKKIGLLSALRDPLLRRALENHALALRKKEPVIKRQTCLDQ